MPSIPFHISTRSFASKTEAKQFFKMMLNGYSLDDRVTEEDAEDLAALLERHTDYLAKVGAGIDHFKVIRNAYNTRSFQIVRVGGTSDDFSYIHCITPKTP